MAKAGLVAAAALALLAAGCGSSSGSERDHRRRRTNLRADGLPSRSAGSPSEADGDRLHDHAARRDAARRLQARPGAAYGRPSDHRQGRSLDDRPPSTRRSAPTAGSARPSSCPPPARTGSWSTRTPRARRRARPTSSSSTGSSSAALSSTGAAGPGAARDDRRLHVHAAPAPPLHAIQPAFLTVTVRDPSGRPAEFTPVVRGARARDLLPQGLARLLPHARLQRGRGRLYERARRDEGDGELDDAREADGRRPRPGGRNLAALPAVPGGRARS